MKAKLPLGTLIHPGHHYAPQVTASMAEQVEGNPFLHFETPEQFTRYRMHDHSRIRSTPYQPVPSDEIRALYAQSE